MRLALSVVKGGHAFVVPSRIGILNFTFSFGIFRTVAHDWGMRIEGLKKYQAAGRGKFFVDLTVGQRACAIQWLRRFINRRRAQGLPLPPWLRAIYYGQAKRLALHPPSSDWGRSMRAKKGGYAVQIKYRCEGRNPTAMATYIRTHGRRQEIRRDNSTPMNPRMTNSGFPPPFQPVTVYRGQVVAGRR
jgi:hypothetical protein